MVHNPNKMTEFMGYEMDQSTRTMLIDLLIATLVLSLIMLPTLFFRGSAVKHPSKGDKET
jgi:hypothetical protein